VSDEKWIEDGAIAEGGAPDKPLSPAARRALAEAAERRRAEAAEAEREPRPAEINGPSGPEPTRYGDWAFKGRVTDF
jgi:hypothetical protein